LIDVTPEEAEMIASALTRKNARARSLAELVVGWDDFVERVERGYSLTIYDYTNDLGTRNLLEHLCHSVTSELARRIRAELKDTDERFRSATVEYPRATVPAAEPDRWWYFRRPKVLVGDLRQDFDDLNSNETELRE
jgi:hypothetical protein